MSRTAIFLAALSLSLSLLAGCGAKRREVRVPDPEWAGYLELENDETQRAYIFLMGNDEEWEYLGEVDADSWKRFAVPAPELYRVKAKFHFAWATEERSYADQLLEIGETRTIFISRRSGL